MNHFETPEYYFKLNQSLSTAYSKSRVYQTVQMAAFDVCFSLLQFLSHKPKIAIIRQGHSVFESLIPIFLRQQTPIQFKTGTQNTSQFLEEIDKETNFVIWSAENEITGEILYSNSVCEEIHKKLSEKRIFSIQVVQKSRSFNKEEILKNQFAVLIEAGGLLDQSDKNNEVNNDVQIFFTEKLKAPSLIGSFQALHSNRTETLAMKNFELKNLSAFEYKNLFQANVDFLQDRKTFIFKDVSAEHLMQKLILQGAVEKNLIFAPSRLPTWILETFKNWWAEAEKPMLILNLLVISNQAFVLNAQLEIQILEVYENIKKESTWAIG